VTSISPPGNGGTVAITDPPVVDGGSVQSSPVEAFPSHGFDLPNIAFDAQTTLACSQYNTDTGGLLTATDGRHAAAIALLGNYMAASFVTTADGHGGTLVTSRVYDMVFRRANATARPLHHGRAWEGRKCGRSAWHLRLGDDRLAQALQELRAPSVARNLAGGTGGNAVSVTVSPPMQRRFSRSENSVGAVPPPVAGLRAGV
jgi:hypothetical protein